MHHDAQTFTNATLEEFISFEFNKVMSLYNVCISNSGTGFSISADDNFVTSLFNS